MGHFGTGSRPSLAVVSFFIGRLLDSRFSEPYRDGIKPAANVFIARPGTEWDIRIYYITAAIGVWVLSKYLNRGALKGEGQTSNKTWFTAMMKSALITVIVLVSAVLLSPLFLHSKVSSKMEISGHSNDSGQMYYLFVRPVDSSNCWLQDPIPIIPGPDGKWNAGAYFGGHEGQGFELIAVASPTPLHPVPFNSPGSYQCSQIPLNAERFVRKVVLK